MIPDEGSYALIKHKASHHCIPSLSPSLFKRVSSLSFKEHATIPVTCDDYAVLGRYIVQYVQAQYKENTTKIENPKLLILLYYRIGCHSTVLYWTTEELLASKEIHKRLLGAKEDSPTIDGFSISIVMQSKEHPRASAAALRDFRHTTRRLYKY
jgi:hypothetical protein